MGINPVLSGGGGTEAGGSGPRLSRCRPSSRAPGRHRDREACPPVGGRGRGLRGPCGGQGRARGRGGRGPLLSPGPSCQSLGVGVPALSMSHVQGPGLTVTGTGQGQGDAQVGAPCLPQTHAAQATPSPSRPLPPPPDPPLASAGFPRCACVRRPLPGQLPGHLPRLQTLPPTLTQVLASVLQPQTTRPAVTGDVSPQPQDLGPRCSSAWARCPRALPNGCFSPLPARHALRDTLPLWPEGPSGAPPTTCGVRVPRVRERDGAGLRGHRVSSLRAAGLTGMARLPVLIPDTARGLYPHGLLRP